MSEFIKSLFGKNKIQAEQQTEQGVKGVPAEIPPGIARESFNPDNAQNDDEYIMAQILKNGPTINAKRNAQGEMEYKQKPQRKKKNT
jgi:hypothetical protein